MIYGTKLMANSAIKLSRKKYGKEMDKTSIRSKNSIQILLFN